MRSKKNEQKELKIYCDVCKKKTVVTDIFQVDFDDKWETFRGIGDCLHLLEFDCLKNNRKEKTI